MNSRSRIALIRATIEIEMNINLKFSEEKLPEELQWYAEPAEWETQAGDSGAGLLLTTDSDTDYWQRTHYGFRRDNGHFLCAATAGDITVETTVHYTPAHDFDQAGLMLRYSPDEWIKTSVEMETDGSFHLGAVATRGGYSDWSTQSFPGGGIDLSLRAIRVGDDVTLQWRSGDGQWQQLRITHLTPPTDTAPLYAGLYAASPDTGGCRVLFDYLTVS